jgi:signal transduction histidine kinase
VLTEMQSSGKRLQQFIQDFLTFSALETGGLKMRFESGNINHCLSDMCRLWSARFQEKGLALYLWERRAAAQPASTGERRRQENSQPNSVKVSVSDTGPGIPAEFHQEVFDDFFRMPGTENQEGMGLGLAIVRRLVQGMGGKIWVESDPGAGCKFSFLIPFKPSPNPAAKGKNR